MGWKYTIDPSKDPREMDWFIEEEPGHPIHQAAIYSLDGDTLKINCAAAGKPRPTNFESRKGDFCSVWFLKRVVAQAVPAQDDARGLVEKAIRAHGGETNVAKLKSARIKVEGEGEFAAGQPPVPLVVEDVWQMPDRYKTITHLTLQGKQVTQTISINATEGWAELDGRTQPLPPVGLKEFKEQKWAEDFDRLLPLRDKSLKLTRIADSKIEHYPVAGIKVEAEGHREVRLYFDSESGLLVKREQEILGDAGKLVVQSVVFSGFEDKGGVKHWTKVAAYRDGVRFITASLRELEIDRKNDAKEFAKPDDQHEAPRTGN